jgi:ubiquinone/menaquinone biosynthesis C-methylase UbiE
MDSSRLPGVPFPDTGAVAIYCASSVDHLLILLEHALAAFPGLAFYVSAPWASTEAGQALPNLKSHHANLHVGADLPDSLDLAILLYSPKGKLDRRTSAGIRRQFSRCVAGRRVIVQGDGTTWRGDPRARVMRKLLRPLYRFLTRVRDCAEETVIAGRLQEEPKDHPPTAARPKKLILLLPQRIEQSLETGNLEKPDFQLSEPAADDLYENDYHSRLYYDERRDWDNLLQDYQQKRWRNLTCVGIAPPQMRGGASSLDIGCGTGGLVGKLADEGFEAMGIDRSRGSILKAQEVFPESAFDCCGIEPLVAQGRQFDLITLSHVLEHVKDDVGFLRALRPLFKPDGKLYIEVPWAHPRALRLRPHWHRQLDHYREYSMQGLAAAVRQSGYTITAHIETLSDGNREPYQCLACQP